ncbi:hypothetical protein [Levilactobacillus huananensis]|uniref:hypothetical protein n=1 Tax=Levilactobacillus huananensis TaxID=2486019 RepID=UPI000F789A0A|nr:hypothetical protein [Levilactobacillus huananensis]
MPTSTITLTGTNVRSRRPDRVTLTLTNLRLLTGDQQLAHLTLQDHVLGIISGRAYQTAQQTLGIRDFRYFLDEANLTLALSDTARNRQAVAELFTFANKHHLWTTKH